MLASRVDVGGWGSVVTGCYWARWSGKVKLLSCEGQGEKVKRMYEEGKSKNEGK